MSAPCPPQTDTVERPRTKDGRRRNNLQHGLRCVTLGSVPTGASYVGRLVQQLRGQLEAAVVSIRGEVRLTDACSINTACRWERHAMLAARWLKLGFDKLTLDQRLNFSREVAKASEARDRAIAGLNLDVATASVIDALYRSPERPEPPHNTDGAE